MVISDPKMVPHGTCRVLMEEVNCAWPTGPRGRCCSPKEGGAQCFPLGTDCKATLRGPLLACCHFSSLFLLCRPSCCQFPLRTGDKWRLSCDVLRGHLLFISMMGKMPWLIKKNGGLPAANPSFLVCSAPQSFTPHCSHLPHTESFRGTGDKGQRGTSLSLCP